VLTVKGKAAAIVQDAAAYQRLLDIAASASAEEGIQAMDLYSRSPRSRTVVKPARSVRRA
jgi:hypothetical protein